MARIFLSYRRDDSSPYAGRLYDRLCQHFGRANLFMDIDTIAPGSLAPVSPKRLAVSYCSS